MGGTSGRPHAHGRHFRLAPGSREELPAGFMLLGGRDVKCKVASHFVSSMFRGCTVRSRLRILIECAVEAAGCRADVAVGGTLCLGGLSGGRGMGIPFWSRSPVRRDRVPETGRLSHPSVGPQPPQTMEQQPWHSEQRFFFFLGWKMVRIASSKTALRPFCVRAEHSK